MLAGRARALHLPAHRLATRRLLAPSGRVFSSRAAAPQSTAVDGSLLRRSAPGLRPPPPDSLRLLNTLTGKSDPFEPIDPACVKWYTCGPTVYDAAHLGHARNYVGFDIVRRVLTDYFGYMLLYVMNITDIDDKIILRTHRNHLEVRPAMRPFPPKSWHLHSGLAS
jgi:cysteinyl-tRNA synthetase